MSKLLKERIRWGIVVMAGLALSFFASTDQPDAIQAAPHSLKRILFFKTEGSYFPLFQLTIREKDNLSTTESAKAILAKQKANLSNKESIRSFKGMIKRNYRSNKEYLQAIKK